MIVATILYEDARSRMSNQFGLHDLVVQCVAEQVGMQGYEVRKFLDGQPRNGANKLRAECRHGMDKLGAKGKRVFAVYDADKVRPQFNLGHHVCRKFVVETLKEGCASPDRLDILLLEQNIESVLECLRSIAPGLATEERWKQAILEKRHEARDIAFQAASKPTPALIPLRKTLLENHVTFARLVHRVALVIRARNAPR